MSLVDVLLSFKGGIADNNQLDFYDAARAIAGFQRSLALTTHLVVNGEIIVQAPSLRGAEILIATPRAGSWEIVATIVGSAFALGTAAKETPVGHLVHSVYDFVVSQTLGFPVDYNKSLFQTYQDQLQAKNITPAKLDSLSEKAERSIADMHRPIVASRSATRGDIYAGDRPNPKRIRLGRELSEHTWEYINKSETERDDSELVGVVSSYNVNTFSGRLFSFDEERPIPFELVENARRVRHIRAITESLLSNAVERGTREGAIQLTGRKVFSPAGRLKAIRVSKVARDFEQEP